METNDKKPVTEKLQNFRNGIQSVIGLTLPTNVVGGNAPKIDATIDFELKNGGK